MDSLAKSEDFSKLITFCPEVLAKLNSSLDAACHQVLEEIRQDIFSNPLVSNLFVRAKGLEFMLKQLEKNNLQIIDVSLSILVRVVRTRSKK